MSKELENRLREKQISPTATRLLVLEFLLKQNAAVSLSDLETEFERADRSTLYRTLKTFEEKGLVHHINDDTETVKYALCQADCTEGDHHDMHLHFHCNICHGTFCLTSSKIRLSHIPSGFIVEEVNLVVNGVCPECK